MASLLQMSSHFLLAFLSFSRVCSSRKWDLELGEAKIDPLLPSEDAALSSGFDHSKSIQLSWNPRVFLYEGFISDEECDHLLSLAKFSKLSKPLATDNTTGDSSSTYVVSSHSGLEHSKGQDEIILRIEERISAWTFLPNGVPLALFNSSIWSSPCHHCQLMKPYSPCIYVFLENGEDMQIFHYRVNEGSETLYQYIQDNIENAKAGPQIAAVLIFLSNVSLGGEIVFPKSKNNDHNTKNGKEMLSECALSGFPVKHVRCNALLIFNLHPNATVDESSLHGGCSVLEGEKWSTIKRIHVRAFDRNELDRKKHSLDSKEECTDEDENCSQWAAMGECQKNSIYMLGTSDYYGSCRKSCGVC